MDEYQFPSSDPPHHLDFVGLKSPVIKYALRMGADQCSIAARSELSASVTDMRESLLLPNPSGPAKRASTHRHDPLEQRSDSVRAQVNAYHCAFAASPSAKGTESSFREETTHKSTSEISTQVGEYGRECADVRSYWCTVVTCYGFEVDRNGFPTGGYFFHHRWEARKHVERRRLDGDVPEDYDCEPETKNLAMT